MSTFYNRYSAYRQLPLKSLLISQVLPLAYVCRCYVQPFAIVQCHYSVQPVANLSGYVVQSVLRLLPGVGPFDWTPSTESIARRQTIRTNAVAAPHNRFRRSRLPGAAKFPVKAPTGFPPFAAPGRVPGGWQ